MKDEIATAQGELAVNDKMFFMRLAMMFSSALCHRDCNDLDILSAEANGDLQQGIAFFYGKTNFYYSCCLFISAGFPPLTLNDFLTVA
ncbi:MAG: hypothetical protein ACTHK0_19690 [Ginsengibacter sp.]